MENPAISQSKIIPDPSQSPLPRNITAFRTPDLLPLKQRLVQGKLTTVEPEQQASYEPVFSLKIRPMKNKSTGRDFNRVKLRNDIQQISQVNYDTRRLTTDGLHSDQITISSGVSPQKPQLLQRVDMVKSGNSSKIQFLNPGGIHGSASPFKRAIVPLSQQISIQHTHYTSLESQDDYASYHHQISGNSNSNIDSNATPNQESVIFNQSNNRNRERYSILEGLENKRIEEFKIKGKKTLKQFQDNKKIDQSIFPSFSSHIDEQQHINQIRQGMESRQGAQSNVNSYQTLNPSGMSHHNMLDSLQKSKNNRMIARQQNLSCLATQSNDLSNPLSFNNSTNISNDKGFSQPMTKITQEALLKLKESISPDPLSRPPSMMKIAPGKYRLPPSAFVKANQTPDPKLSLGQMSPLKEFERIPSLGSAISGNSPGGMNSIQMFLNNTLTKLKRKPNQRNLKPLDILQKFQQQLADQINNFKKKEDDESSPNGAIIDLSNEINLDDLTQEDKFFLIQQIENIQQNIRYGQDGSPFIFQDFDENDNDDQQMDSESIDSPQMINVPKIKGFKEHIKTLEIINDADEDDEIDLTSVNDEDNVLMSQATMEQISPQVKQTTFRHNADQRGIIVINSPSDLRKLKQQRQGAFGNIKRSMSMEEIKMFSKHQPDNSNPNFFDEDDIIMTDNIEDGGSSIEHVIKQSALLNNKNIIMPDEFSRNKRNIIKSNIGDPVDGVRSRNNVVPSFHISETNLTNDVIKEDEDNNEY